MGLRVGLIGNVLFIALLLSVPAHGAGDLTFAIIGDYGSGSPQQDRVAAAISRLEVDLVLTVGDNNYGARTCDGFYERVSKPYEAYVSGADPSACAERLYRMAEPDSRQCKRVRTGVFDPICSSCETDPGTVAFFPTPGNHDIVQHKRFNGTEMYIAHFPWARQQCAHTPCTDAPITSRIAPALDGIFSCRDASTPAFYDVVRGEVHFFLLDSTCSDPTERDVVAACKNRTLSCKDPASYAAMTQCEKNQCVQRLWLEQAVRASTAKFKIILFHHAPYSSSPHHPACASMQADFAALGIHAVITGHSHVYERLISERLGPTRYYVNGVGGAGLYATCTGQFTSAAPGVVEGSVYRDISCGRSGHGFQLGRISGDIMTLEFRTVDSDIPMDRCRFESSGSVTCAEPKGLKYCKVLDGRLRYVGGTCNR